MNKILAVKNENNILIYSINYSKDVVRDLLKYIAHFYGYIEYKEVEALIKDDKLLTTGNFYPNKKYNYIYNNFEILNVLKEFEDNSKLVKAKIKIFNRSVVSDALENIFLSDKIMINLTEFIKIMNHVEGSRNNFVFNPSFDLKTRCKLWNDPSRAFVSIREYDRYLEHKKNKLNSDDIKLNKNEEAKLEKDLNTIINKLLDTLNVIQIGMFPIDKEMGDLNTVLYNYGLRNESIKYRIPSLEEVPININGSTIINELKDNIISEYNENNNKVKEVNEEINKKVKYFLAA